MVMDGRSVRKKRYYSSDMTDTHEGLKIIYELSHFEEDILQWKIRPNN